MKTVEEKREYQREWHQKNKEKRIAVQIQRKNDIKQRFKEYKQTLKCNRCGFDNHRALQFHHLRDKEITVHKTVQNGRSWERIMEEIAKCEVLCANCHFIEHYID